MRLLLRKSQFVLVVWFVLTSIGRAEPVSSTFSGSSSNRVDVAFVGDGYTESELGLYASHVENAIDYMFRGTEEPFNRYQNYFNFHRIEVTSAESGTDFAPPANRGLISGILDGPDNSAPNVIEFYTDTVLPAGTTYRLDQYTPGSFTPVSTTLTLDESLPAGSFAYIFSEDTTAAEFDAWFGANSTGNSTVFTGAYSQGGENSSFVLNDVAGRPIDAFGSISGSNQSADWVYRDSLTRGSGIFDASAFQASPAEAFAGATSNEEAGENAFPLGSYVAPERVFVDTALDSRFFFDGVTERLLSVNLAKALEVENRSLSAPAEMRFAVINSEEFGGAGGPYATFAGGHFAAAEIGLHEIAHSFAGLADEYEGFPGVNPNGEPVEPNVTTDPQGLKWEQWLGYEQEGIGEIGAYEGGRYYSQGIYRPSLNSKMRALFQPFDAVSREQLVLQIYEHVQPIDDHAPNSDSSGTLSLDFADDAWVNVVDTDTIDVTWQVNGEQIDFDGELLPISEFVTHRIAPGVYDLTATATDNTDWIRLEDQRPRQEVTWTVRYYPGDFNGNELLDVEDIDALTAIASNPDDNDPQFDLTLDSLVNQDDRDLWVLANQVLLGDADLNGTVEFADFLALSSNFGSDETSWGNGNFDGESGVTFADFLLLSGNFGASAASITSVPEPASRMATLAILAALMLLRNRNR